MTASVAPVLVTGLPRSGTSWVGKMLQAGGELVYVNEPMNPAHPPGRSPGVLDANVEHYFHYICDRNGGPWLVAFRDTVALRYRLLAELRRNRRPYDLARAAKYLAAFTRGRYRGQGALIDDPYAVMSVAWLVENVGVRAVVLVRHPVAFVGSWRKLGWSVDPGELLDQPLLLADHLEPFREQLRSLRGSSDWLATSCLLWCAAYTVVDSVRRAHPGVILQRHEDLSRDPVQQFRALYDALGLRWTDRVEERVRGATAGTRADARGFTWSFRSGISRTAFQPMDSRAALESYRSRLRPAEIDRILDFTKDVRALYYHDASLPGVAGGPRS
jgi:hypothetical protein